MRLLGVLFNERLMDFTESHELRSPVQAVSDERCRVSISCWCCSTALIRRCSCTKAACFAALLICKQGAYDNVPRELLWQRLAALGIHGAMLGCIRGMYANSGVATKVGGKMGRVHPRTLG